MKLVDVGIVALALVMVIRARQGYKLLFWATLAFVASVMAGYGPCWTRFATLVWRS
jgi:hypothetical protein